MSEQFKTLDLRGLKCPLPVLKTDKAMKSLSEGECIVIETTDPLAVIDIPAFCQEKGHLLKETSEYENFVKFILQKGIKG